MVAVIDSSFHGSEKICLSSSAIAPESIGRERLISIFATGPLLFLIYILRFDYFAEKNFFRLLRTGAILPRALRRGAPARL